MKLVKKKSRNSFNNLVLENRMIYSIDLTIFKVFHPTVRLFFSVCVTFKKVHVSTQKFKKIRFL